MPKEFKTPVAYWNAAVRLIVQRKGPSSNQKLFMYDAEYAIGYIKARGMNGQPTFRTHEGATSSITNPDALQMIKQQNGEIGMIDTTPYVRITIPELDNVTFYIPAAHLIEKKHDDSERDRKLYDAIITQVPILVRAKTQYNPNAKSGMTRDAAAIVRKLLSIETDAEKTQKEADAYTKKLLEGDYSSDDYQEKLAKKAVDEVAKENDAGTDLYQDALGEGPETYGASSQITLLSNAYGIEAVVPGSMPERPFVGRSALPSDTAAMLLEPGSFLRIGDVRLPFTVERISVSTQSDIDTVPILRNRGTMKRNAGHATTRVDIALTVVGLRDINGWTLDYTGNILQDPITAEYPILTGILMEHGGLRPLVSTFRRMPFVPVVNSTLNVEHGIDALAFVGLQVSTTDEAPDTLEVQLSFLKFDYSVYTPDITNFADLFCWPLYSKYVYNGLCVPEEYGTVATDKRGLIYDFDLRYKNTAPRLVPIPTLAESSNTSRYEKNYGLVGGVTFYTAREEDLRIIREEGVYATKQRQLAGLRQAALEDLRAAEKAQRAIKQQLGPATAREALPIAKSINRKIADDAIAQLYRGGGVEPAPSVRIANTDEGVAAIFSGIPRQSDALIAGTANFIPSIKASTVHETQRRKAEYLKEHARLVAQTPTLKPYYELVAVKQALLTGTSQDIRAAKTSLSKLRAGVLKPALKGKSLESVMSSAEGIHDVLSALDHEIENLLDKTVRTGEELAQLEATSARVAAAKQRRRELLLQRPSDLVDEAVVAYEPWALPNTVSLQHVDVIMANSFSSLQLEGREQPTLQYLGGQDTKVRLVFWCEENGVQEGVLCLRSLQEHVQRLSREYRWTQATPADQDLHTGNGIIGAMVKNSGDRFRGQQIETGFLKLDQEIANLCGVESMLIESVEFEAIPEAPGCYQIVMDCIDFDRTQKKHETLNKVRNSSAFGTVGMGRDAGQITGRVDTNPTNSPESAIADIHRKALVDEIAMNDLLYGTDLYPDLDLPTYSTVNAWIRELYHMYADLDSPEGSRSPIAFPLYPEVHGRDVGTETTPPVFATHYYDAPLDGRGRENAMLYDMVHVDPDFYTSTTETVAALLIEELGTQIIDVSRTDEHGSGADQYSVQPTRASDATAHPTPHMDGSKPLTAQEMVSSPPLDSAFWEPINGTPGASRSALEENIELTTIPTDKLTYVDPWSQRRSAAIAAKTGKAAPAVYGPQPEQTTFVPSRQAGNVAGPPSPSSAAGLMLQWKNATKIYATSGRIDPLIEATLRKAAAHVPSASYENFAKTALLIAHELKKRNIMTPATIVAALATVAVESGTFKPVKESHWLSDAVAKAGFKKYEFRQDLGNIHPGDGVKYHGRGYIQLTGRANYTKYGKLLGLNLVEQPDLALESPVAAQLFASYFYDHGITPDAAAGNWSNVRKKVNGGLTHYADFVQYVNAFTKALGFDAVVTTTAEKIDQVITRAQEIPDRPPSRVDAAYGGPDYDSAPLFAHLVDWYKHCKHGRLVRAFPTFWSVLIDGGRFIGTLLLNDQFYGFNGVSSITVVKNREQPAHLCILEMSNVYGNLTNATAQRALDEGVRRTKLSEVWYYMKSFVTNPIEDVDIMKREQEVTGLYLAPGARLHVRMGYGNCPRSLPTVFNGTITEVPGGEGLIEIVAQGDGIELQNDIQALPNNKLGGFFHGSEPQDMICALLSARGAKPGEVRGGAATRFVEWIKQLGAWLLPHLYNDNPFGIYHFGNPHYRAGHEMFGECMHNVYRSNDRGARPGSPDDDKIVFHLQEFTAFLDTFSWGQKEFSTELYGKTVWDLCALSAQVAPDYICQVVPFGFRSTLFYGKPYYNLTYDYDLTQFLVSDPDNKDREILLGAHKSHWAVAGGTLMPLCKPADDIRKRVTRHGYLRKPFQQCYGITDIDDIITNGITPTTEGVYTVVRGTYKGKHILPGGKADDPGTPATDMTMAVFADYTIFPTCKRTAVVPTEIYVGTIDASLQFMTNRDVHNNLPNNVATSILQNFMRYMYKGKLTLIGTPSIKPFDVLVIDDNYTDLHGPVGVREVVHSLSLGTGLTTTVEPDCLVTQIDQRLIRNWSLFRNICGIVSVARRHTAATAHAMRTEITPSLWTTAEQLIDMAEYTDQYHTPMSASLKSDIAAYRVAQHAMHTIEPTPDYLSAFTKMPKKRSVDTAFCTKLQNGRSMARAVTSIGTFPLDFSVLKNSVIEGDYIVPYADTAGPSGYALERLAYHLTGTDDIGDGLIMKLSEFIIESDGIAALMRDGAQRLKNSNPGAYSNIMREFRDHFVQLDRDLEQAVADMKTWYPAEYQTALANIREKMDALSRDPQEQTATRTDVEPVEDLLALADVLLDVRVGKIARRDVVGNVDSALTAIADAYDIRTFGLVSDNGASDDAYHTSVQFAHYMVTTYPELFPSPRASSALAGWLNLGYGLKFRNPRFGLGITTRIADVLLKKILTSPVVLGFVYNKAVPIVKGPAALARKLAEKFKQFKAPKWIAEMKQSALAQGLGEIKAPFVKLFAGISDSLKDVALVKGFAELRDELKIIKGSKAARALRIKMWKSPFGGLVKGIKGVIKGPKTAATVFGALLGDTNPVGWIIKAALGITIGNLCNQLSRSMRNEHAVQMMVLQKHGAEYSAGINGHQGLIYGDRPHYKQAMFNNLSGERMGKDFQGTVGGIIGGITSIVGLNYPYVPQMTPAERAAVTSAENLFNGTTYGEYSSQVLIGLGRLRYLGELLTYLEDVSNPHKTLPTKK